MFVKRLSTSNDTMNLLCIDSLWISLTKENESSAQNSAGVRGVNTPFRPIVSSIGAYSYNLAKYLCNLLTPLTPAEFCAKDSFSFVNEIQKLSMQKRCRAYIYRMYLHLHCGYSKSNLTFFRITWIFFWATKLQFLFVNFAKFHLSQNNFGIRCTLKLQIHSTKTHEAKSHNMSKTTNK